MIDNDPLEKDVEDVLIDDKNSFTKKAILSRLRTYFLAGLVVTAPIGITIYLAWSFLQILDRIVAPIIPGPYNPNTYMPFSLPGLGFIITVIFFIIVGWLTKNYLGRVIVRWSEYVVERVPVINKIYIAIKQVMETIMASKSDAFKEVIMFEYPRKGMWVLGFLTGVTKGEVQELTDTEVVNVFLPTTPNPTSGFLLFVPKKDITFMKMTVEEGIKMIVSGGIITPQDPEEIKED